MLKVVALNHAGESKTKKNLIEEKHHYINAIFTHERKTLA